LLTHCFVKLLPKKRSVQIKKLQGMGQAITCFGDRILVRNHDDARSALAQQAQAIELKLIYPVYEVAMKTKDFRVMLHQHDGVSIKFTRREQAWRKKIDQAVKSNAQAL